MKTDRAHRLLLAIATCLAVMSIGGCASFPGMEGGIVGTGNRIDCPNEDKSRDCERPAR